jgi:hypothetical protein
LPITIASGARLDVRFAAFVPIPVFLLAASTATTAQPSVESPIRVGNAQVNPLDLSVTYEYTNDSLDVTAYEVTITRHFADGSKIVSTPGTSERADDSLVIVDRRSPGLLAREAVVP